MICPKCNAQVEDDRKTCPECGHSLGTPENDAQPGRTEKEPEPDMMTRIRRSHFVKRVFNILFKSVAEWKLIAATKPRIGFMIFGYLLILAIIIFPALFFGYVLDLLREGINYREMFVLSLYCLLRLFGLILFPIIAAVVINALRPSFGVGGSFGRTLQLTVYSATPVFLSWALFLLPFALFYNALIHIISLYAILLLVNGYRKVLAVPGHKRIGFLFTVLGIFYATYYIFFYVTQLFYPLLAIYGAPDAGRLGF